MMFHDRRSSDAAFARTLGEAGPAPAANVVRADGLVGAATCGRASSLLRHVRGVLRASPWTVLAARGLLLMLGLVVLAWIGRAATAATPHSAGAPASFASDAGIATGAPATAALLPPPPMLAQASPPPPRVTGAPSSSPAPPSSPSHARATAEDPVYINYASTEELRRLPGVGPKRAEAIIALRQRMGRFQRVEDLLRVKGIGRATLRKWRPLVRLDAPAAADAGAPRAADDGVRAP